MHDEVSLSFGQGGCQNYFFSRQFSLFMIPSWNDGLSIYEIAELGLVINQYHRFSSYLHIISSLFISFPGMLHLEYRFNSSLLMTLSILCDSLAAPESLPSLHISTNVVIPTFLDLTRSFWNWPIYF